MARPQPSERFPPLRQVRNAPPVHRHPRRHMLRDDGLPTWRRRSSKGFAPRQEPDGRHRSKTATSMNGRGEQPNTGLDLTNPDAAQSVILPLCLLTVFAAEHHVGLVESV